MRSIIRYVLTITTVDVAFSQSGCPSGLSSYEGYCIETAVTTYPFKCRYMNEHKYNEPSIPNGPTWVSMKDPHYGYFYREARYRQLYGSFTSRDGNTDGACLYKTDNEYFLSSCDTEGIYGACVYDPEDEDFCRSYHRICKRRCEGRSSYKGRFSCGAIFRDDDSCERCDEEYEKYPHPAIELRRSSEKSMTVVLSNRAKIVPNRDPTQLELLDLYCFTTSVGFTNVVWNYQSAYEPYLVARSDDTEIIDIPLSAEGVYFCHVLVFPNMTYLESEEIVFVWTSYHNFVVNVTLDMDPVGIPYTLHADAKVALKEALNYDDGIIVALLFLYPQVNRKITASFRLSTPTDVTIESYHARIRDVLPKHYSLAACEYCLQERIVVNGRNLTWPSTKPGASVPTVELIVDQHGWPTIRSCHGTFKQGTYWGEFLSKGISTPSSRTRVLYEIFTSNLSAEEINNLLSEVLKNNSTMTPYDVYLTASCLEKMINSDEPYNASVAIASIEATMNLDRHTLYLSQINLNATDIILYAYDRILQSQTGDGGNVMWGKQTIARIFKLDGRANGIALYKNDGGISMELLNVRIPLEINKADLMIASYIPQNLLEEVQKTHTDKEIYLASAVFLNNSLFNDVENRPNWQVISMFMPDVKYPYFLNPFPVIFGERFENFDAVQTCLYWNYGIDNHLVSLFGQWKHGGPMVTGPNYKICYFNHMTHFAAMFGAPESSGVNIVTAILASLSLLCILSMFLTAVCFARWRREEGVKVLLHYSIAIMLQDVLILLSDRVDVSNHVWCTIYGALLHFSVLSQFMWMLIISIVQYRKLVQVFHSPMNGGVLKFVLIAWVVPLVPIAIVLFLNVNSYTNTEYCFISGLNLNLSLFLPILLIVVVNLITFTRIMMSLCKASNAVGKSLTQQKISITVLLFFLTGCSWIFGLLANDFQNVLLSYTFCSLTIAQGFVLWIYFIVMRREVVEFWRDTLKAGRQNATELNISISRPSLRVNVTISNS